jgi:acyl dehydratase
VSEWKVYFEDLEIGEVIETSGQTLTDADVVRYRGFTGEWDEPFGDAGQAPASDSAKRTAPELLALCVCLGLGWRVPRPPVAIQALVRLEWEFRCPLWIGDTIRSRSRTLAKRSVKDGGVVVEERVILNQRGEVVQSGRLTLLVAKRSAR